MRIHNQPEMPAADRASVRGVAAAAPVATSETTVGKAGAEKVTVSAQALSLAEQHGANEAKMARLAASLKEGSFKVDSGAIAAKLVGGDE